MSIFVQSLESRTFLSASPITKATLVADNANIVADIATANAALKTLVAELKTDTSNISKDLKTLPKTNAALLKTLKTDESKAQATLKADLALLVKPGSTLAKKSATTGELLLTKATLKTVAVESVEITALGTVTTAPLANLTTALDATTVDTDLAALVTANPGATALATDVATATGDLTTQATAIGSDSAQFNTDIANLATDLGSVNTAVGTLPDLVGTFSGTANTTAGKHSGETNYITLIITSEDSAGDLVGTLSDFTFGDTYALKGTISLNSIFAGKITSPGNPAVALLGAFESGNITGTFKFSGAAGTFNVDEMT